MRHGPPPPPWSSSPLHPPFCHHRALRLHVLLVTHDDHNTVVLWDPLPSGKPLLLDFARELARVEKTKVKMVRVLCTV